MGVAYLNQEDMMMRLGRSIVKYDDDFFITGTTTSSAWYEISLTRFEGQKGKPLVVDHRSDKFDASSPQLGYLNHQGRAYYPSRLPTRRQVQGLDSSNITFANGNHPRGSWFMSSGFYDMLHNKYPALEGATKALMSLEVQEMAIHRLFAIGWMDSTKIGLYFKGNMIGYRDEIKGKYTVIPSKESSFITRLLSKESIINAKDLS